MATTFLGDPENVTCAWESAAPAPSTRLSRDEEADRALQERAAALRREQAKAEDLSWIAEVRALNHGRAA
jgi:hypothetical protein